DRFERIRYPDHILEHGMLATLSWNPQRVKVEGEGAGKNLPHYEFAVTDLDRLIGTLFRLCSINPAGSMGFLNEHGVKVLENDNPACKGWFPEREHSDKAGAGGD